MAGSGKDAQISSQPGSGSPSQTPLLLQEGLQSCSNGDSLGCLLAAGLGVNPKKSD